MQSLLTNDLKNLIDSNAKDILLIDVRSPQEYEGGHIPFALNIPLSELKKEKVEQLSNGRKIITVCKSGTRSKIACQQLEASGIDNILTVTGGTEAWKNSGHAIEGKGTSVISLERQVRIGAGFLVLSGVLLGSMLNTGFYLLSAFVGAGLIFSGITDWCGMGLILSKLPWNCKGELSCQKN